MRFGDHSMNHLLRDFMATMRCSPDTSPKRGEEYVAVKLTMVNTSPSLTWIFSYSTEVISSASNMFMYLAIN